MDCSPEAYSIHNDTQYINEVVEVVEQCGETVYVVEVAPIEEHHNEQIDVETDEYQLVTQADGYSEEIAVEREAQVTQTEGKKILWSKLATKLMLSLLEDILPDVGTSDRLPNKTEMWKLIADEMRKDGYSFSAGQVENKFRAVERQYKKKSRQNEQEKVTKRSSHKLREMGLPENEEKPGAEVVWMCCDEPDISSQEQITEFKVETNSEPIVERASEEDFPTSLTKQRKDTSSRPLHKTFAKMATERKRYHEKIIQFLKKKEERGRKREERDQKKLELLELLLSKQA